MKIDYMVKEELWRSLPVFFFSFLIIGFLDRKGNILLGVSGTFILALVFTVIHFSLMVWYRKKEGIASNSIFFIINYIFSSKSREERTRELYKDEETGFLSSFKRNIRLLIVTVLLYVAYLYTSLVYNIDQIFWILVLLLIGGALSKIIYGEKKTDQKAPVRLLVFYLIGCIFIFVRYLVLDYPIFPILKGSVILGILLVLLVLGIRWSHHKRNSEN